MARDTLPDGTTHQDVDDNFGDPDTDTVRGIVSYEVEVEVPRHSTPAERREALQEAVEDEGEVVHTEVTNVGP